MSLTWVITEPLLDDDHDTNKKLVLRSFSDKGEALEELYVMYMEQVLGRNRYTSFSSLLELECYGSIVDAIQHSPLERIRASEITRDTILKIQFSNEKGRRLRDQMLVFYEKSEAFSKICEDRRGYRVDTRFRFQ